MDKYLLFGIMALVIIISGCVGQENVVGVGTGKGVLINSFITTPSLTEVQSGDTVLFDLEVQNVGGTTAKNVEVDLFGIESQWRDVNGNLISSTQKQSFGVMRPPAPERNLDGDIKTAQWEFMTPQVPQGLRSLALPVEARVTFDYNTSGFIQITALSDDEFRRQKINGETPAPPTIQNSDGPIKMTVPTAEKYQYIVLDTISGQATVTYPFRIVFTNVGTGFPITPEKTGALKGAGGRLTGTIELRGPGVEFSNCLGVTSGNTINLNDASITTRIRDTENAPIACTVKFDLAKWGGRPSDTIMFLFNINYRYYEKQTVNINVVGV